MSPTLNKTYVSIIVNYSYTTNKTHHHAGKFLPNQKIFPHDITLKASVVGESVTSHGTGYWRDRHPS